MKRLVDAWYQGSPLLKVFRPLSYLYQTVSKSKRKGYLDGSRPSWRAPVPVIVVGNITVGGVGKTPFVAWLAEHLKNKGYSPAIVSRGYGGKGANYPCAVQANSDPSVVGDEPLMLATRTGCPVVVDPDRPQAVLHAIEHCGADVIISDDGLQHYALNRDIEIVVIDSERGLGNRKCLPEGPLREPPDRLKSVDFVLLNGAGTAYPKGHRMQLVPGDLVNLKDGRQHVDAHPLTAGQSVHAVAGIGNPDRFFKTLAGLGYKMQRHAFPDHHHFSVEDVTFGDALPVIMTEKDAVKCRPFAEDYFWYLPVEAELESSFVEKLTAKIEELL